MKEFLNGCTTLKLQLTKLMDIFQNKKRTF